MIRKIYIKNTGFTLLEALVAVSILMVAVVAPITIAQKGLSSAIYTKNQMIASYLAQDAIEYIKNVRDENILKGDYWLTGFTDCFDLLSCQIDTIENSVSPYSDESPLLKNDNDFYGYLSGGDVTSFTRSINIKLNPKETNDDEALINVIVRWDNDLDKKVNVPTLIYNY